MMDTSTSEYQQMSDAPTTAVVSNEEEADEAGRMDEDADGAEDAEADDQPSVPIRDPLERPVHKLSVKLLDTYKYINKVIRLLGCAALGTGRNNQRCR